MKRFLLLILFTSMLGITMAQSESDPYGSEYNYDSTDYSNDFYNNDYSSNEPIIEEAPKYKKYERFKAPIDTITELVTYTGVVPFVMLENDVYDGGDIDSLYLRAKIFLMQRYIKDYRQNSKKGMIFPKDLLIEDVRPDGENGRIIIRPTIDLMIRNNSFSSTPSGTVSFKVEIRVKEDKYKYKLTNFVHNTVERGSEKPIKTYIEYYVNNNRGVKNTDYILLAIDRIVKEFVKDLAKVMKDPVVLDPDEF